MGRKLVDGVWVWMAWTLACGLRTRSGVFCRADTRLLECLCEGESECGGCTNYVDLHSWS